MRSGAVRGGCLKSFGVLRKEFLLAPTFSSTTQQDSTLNQYPKTHARIQHGPQRYTTLSLTADRMTTARFVHNPWARAFSRWAPHFLFYEVISLPRCVIPYRYRKLLELMFALTMLQETTVRRARLCPIILTPCPYDPINGAQSPNALASVHYRCRRPGQQPFAGPPISHS